MAEKKARHMVAGRIMILSAVVRGHKVFSRVRISEIEGPSMPSPRGIGIVLEKSPQNLFLPIGILAISRYFSEKHFFSNRSACAL
jgi:hypothetical protein